MKTHKPFTKLCKYWVSGRKERCHRPAKFMVAGNVSFMTTPACGVHARSKKRDGRKVWRME